MSEIKPLDRGQWKKVAIQLRDENEELKSQLAATRQAVWELFDYVDLPPSDYRTDDIEQAWDLFLKIYRDLQKETESELSDEAT
jgi:hypothetical protein